MDKFKDMTVEQINAALEEAQAKINTLFSVENPTPEQYSEATALAEYIRAGRAELETREASAKEVEDGFAALRSEFSEAPSEEEEPEDEPEEEETPEAEVEEPEVEVETPEPVSASTKGVKALAKKTPRPPKPEADTHSPVVITAAPDVPNFSAGKVLGMEDVAKAVIARAQGFTPPTGDGKSVDLRTYGTAVFNFDIPKEFTVDRWDDAQDIIAVAGDETRLPGNSLTAAGGWCAPSEMLYDLTDDSTGEGLLSLPEIGVKRGGIRFAQSPTFADFYANPGFIQTEAQAIAGTTKPCIDIECPEFDEVRLDAEGICIRVPILTNAAYPEVVRNFVSGSMNAHLHWMNANIIGRLVTAAGAARVVTGLGSTLTDTLEGLELLADQTRQKYRLSLSRTLEVVLPFWVRGAIRSDLSRRTGVPFENVGDSQIAAHFRSRKLNVQFVYDWQPLDETAEVYPDTFNALMYPAGTFVKGTAPVINLSTVYDAASLATNTYTGLFFEQGILVAHRKFHADLITLPVCNAGRTGAADLTCAVTP